MSFFYLSDDDKEKCFVYYAKGTIFQDEPAYVTAYDICEGLTEHFNEVEANACRFSIPLRDASSGRYFTIAATRSAIDNMISWLRTKHDIFYTPVLDLDTVLGFDGLSHRVEAFWDIEDKRQEEAEREDQEKLEEYCKNDVACGLSLKKMHMQYVAHHEEPITPAVVMPPMEFIEELWKAIYDEPVPEIKTTTDQLKFYRKVLRTVAKQHNELRTLKGDFDSLNKSYDQLWEDRERKKRMLNSFYGATCGATADAYGEIQRLKKERDELKERLENLEGGGHVCSGCKHTTCGYFTEILSTLGVKNMVVWPARGQSKVECLAKLANERAQLIFNENQTLMQQVDSFIKTAAEDKDKIEGLKRVISGLNIRVNNQSSIIKTQNESLTKQRKQLKDLGVALSNVKEVVDCEMDDLMKTHGDDIIPIF